MFRTILVPLDGSPRAEWALPAAIGIARRHGAQLQLLTVQVLRAAVSAIDGLTFSDGSEAWRAAAEDASQTYLTEVARRVEVLHPVTIKSVVRAEFENAARQLVQHAHDSDIDLIVMATHGHGPLMRLWLGSVADAVVRHSQIPTLLIRPRSDEQVDLKSETHFRNILIPLDGSDAAETIIDHAIAVGGYDAEYTLFQAFPLLPVFSTEYAAVSSVDAETMHAQQESAEATLETLAERIRLRDVRFRVHIATASKNTSAEAILDYAQRNHNDLIALTTHGRGGAIRLMLGSVADKVTRGAEVPVLLYRPA